MSSHDSHEAGRLGRGAMKLPMLGPDDKLAEIRRLYFSTTSRTIQDDIARALDLLKSMANEDERERAAVYMDGLSQMRSDWSQGKRQKAEGRRQKVKGKR